MLKRKRIIKRTELPQNSILIARGFQSDYTDCYRIACQNAGSIDDVLTQFFTFPKSIKSLFQLRNSIASKFGLQSDFPETATYQKHYKVGEKAVLFNVVERNENEIVMSESDSHLNFELSLLADEFHGGFCVTVTTLVKFNNIWGNLYFLPVKPFHKLIIKSMLKRLYCTNGKQ